MVGDFIHGPPDWPRAFFDCSAELRKGRWGQLRCERHLVKVDDGPSVDMQVTRVAFCAKEDAAQLFRQFRNLGVELGELAVQRDFDFGLSRGWQDDGFKRLTAAIGSAPPRNEEGIDTCGVGELEVPRGRGDVGAVVRADERLRGAEPSRRFSGLLFISPETPACLRPRGGVIPSIIESPDGRMGRYRFGCG